MKISRFFLSSPNAIHLAWLALIGATLIAWWLGETIHDAQGDMRIAVAGVIATAFVKVWLVGFQFMELRHAPRWLRHGFDLWVVAIAITLVVICLG